MRKQSLLSLTFTLIACVAAWAQQTNWTNLTVSPTQPRAGETVRFEYNIAGGKLAKADNVEVVAVEFAEGNPVMLEVAVANNGQRLIGTLSTSSKALTLMLAFKAGENWDNNGGEGYFMGLADANGKAQIESLAAQAMLYRQWGGMFELNRKPALTFALLEKALSTQSSLKEKYFIPYINSMMALKRDAGKADALKFLEELEGKIKNEKDLLTIADLYERSLGIPDRANAIRARLRTDFPNGLLVRKDRREQIQYQSDLAAREAAIDAYAKDFPPQTDEERYTVGSLYNRLAQQHAEKQDWDKFHAVAAKMSEAERYSLYNELAWNMGENNDNLQQALKMSREATDWAEAEMNAPKGAKPPLRTASDWLMERKFRFAQWADTYALLLDHTGDPKKAAQYQARVIELSEGKDAEMNERYTTYLEHAGAADLRYQLEGFILKGQASPGMKEQFKRLFAAEDKSEAGTAAYLQKLEEVARAHKRAELAASMMNEAAPAFSLKNLQGETVSLESLRGKVVVVDFWATWCGPCKMSFPGMQEAVNKYKDDSQVAFVFVDCWERAADKVKNAADFIASKSYTFNVLMDTEDKVVADFGVSGIPTKFILDAKGRIRFKSIGYNGSNEALVDELTTMIELARQQP